MPIIARGRIGQSSIPPHAIDHPEYIAFEKNKHRKMKWGLGFLTVGFILQMIPNFCQIIFN